MWNLQEVHDYFYEETRDFEVSNASLIETKYSYFDTIDCYKVDYEINEEF